MNEITSQSGGANRTLSYDLNGNITSDGTTRTFEWDAANHLIAINYTGQTTRSEFTYDGLGRVAKIVEKTGSTINSTRKFVWCGNDKCEYRDAADIVTLRVYPQGELSGNKPNFYTRDHLGSIREMFGSTGTVVARYDYDPYGRSTTILGTTPTEMNFTGLYRHSKSNLDLAAHRAYDPELGRWLSRDPVEEEGGVNLYGYVSNDLVNMSDPSGLEAEVSVYRTSRTSQSSVFVYENGKFLGAFFGNQGTFIDGRRGPPDGTYYLKPKNNWEEGDVFAPGTPSITGDGLEPGVPVAGDPAVFRVHPEGPSRGCLTGPIDWANRIWDIMDRNINSGGTTIRYETGSAPKAIPNRQPRLRAPKAHKWW